MPPERPHSWCNFLDVAGVSHDRVHTADFWEWAVILTVKWDGAHVSFFKRTAPDEFTCFGGFIEGLEKTEEVLLKLGVDVYGLRDTIDWNNRKGWAKHATEGQYDDPTGMIMGGLWHSNWDLLERFYEDAYAKH